MLARCGRYFAHLLLEKLPALRADVLALELKASGGVLSHVDLGCLAILTT